MQTAPALDRETFRKVCGRFATGIAVATVRGRDGKPTGLTINSFASVSAAPPLVLICIDYRCSALADFRSNSWFAVNILTEAQQDLSVRFAESQGDRFAGVSWREGETGAPLLEGCLAALECCVSQVVEAGDHAIFLAEVVRGEWLEDGRPLLYFASSYGTLDSD